MVTYTYFVLLLGVLISHMAFVLAFIPATGVSTAAPKATPASAFIGCCQSDEMLRLHPLLDSKRARSAAPLSMTQEPAPQAPMPEWVVQGVKYALVAAAAVLLQHEYYQDRSFATTAAAVLDLKTSASDLKAAVADLKSSMTLSEFTLKQYIDKSTDEVKDSVKMVMVVTASVGAVLSLPLVIGALTVVKGAVSRIVNGAGDKASKAAVKPEEAGKEDAPWWRWWE
ncbi:hypothetical protein JKP88DRAFT_226718 [Tribonema minus]|uniref:Uncharacterized protein n=1 Tax=Tribonema minus TaxID=303371 RepID=A0A835YML0_9STRA|nr:hypothetical protein JKP88DRAFT_226718 [Tribonema minus]